MMTSMMVIAQTLVTFWGGLDTNPSSPVSGTYEQGMNTLTIDQNKGLTFLFIILAALAPVVVDIMSDARLIM